MDVESDRHVREVAAFAFGALCAMTVAGCGACGSTHEVRVSPSVRMEIRRPPANIPHLVDRGSTAVMLWVETDGGTRRVAGPAPALRVATTPDASVVLVDVTSEGAKVIGPSGLIALRDLGTGCDFAGTLFDGPPTAGCAGCAARNTEGWTLCERATYTLVDTARGVVSTWTAELPDGGALCSQLDRLYAVSREGRPVVVLDCPVRKGPDDAAVRPSPTCFAIEVQDGGSRELWRWDAGCDERAADSSDPLAAWEADLAAKAPGLGLRLRLLPKTFQ